jgi:hypothetical protein
LQISNAGFAFSALALYFLSFQFPFISTDFSISEISSVKSIVSSAENICGLEDVEEDSIFAGVFKENKASLCERFLQNIATKFSWEILERSLGPVHDGLSWAQCGEQSPDYFIFVFNGADIPNSRIEACVKHWVSSALGLELGNQSLLDIFISLSDSREYLLLLLILLLGLGLPFMKIFLMMVKVYRNDNRNDSRLTRILSDISKWSMADVFVVAFLIVVFKAEAVGLEVRAEPGLFLFALGSIASSLGYYRIVMMRVPRMEDR